MRPDLSGYVPGGLRLRLSSDPLVGELLAEVTDQGADGGGHTKTARGPGLGAVLGQRLRFRSSRGPPGLFSSVVVWPCAGSGPPLLSSREGGGDEETRTPDLLLAKEMLYQLSYVPLASRE